mmetsp:Transcript_10639/g.20849  ORF Transcript_10639/g.20849 Transcript_10639/m.20849 type:complete len:200 (-) Transcript_10639:732-1331(-)
MAPAPSKLVSYSLSSDWAFCTGFLGEIVIIDGVFDVDDDDDAPHSFSSSMSILDFPFDSSTLPSVPFFPLTSPLHVLSFSSPPFLGFLGLGANMLVIVRDLYFPFSTSTALEILLFFPAVRSFNRFRSSCDLLMYRVMGSFKKLTASYLRNDISRSSVFSPFRPDRAASCCTFFEKTARKLSAAFVMSHVASFEIFEML